MAPALQLHIQTATFAALQLGTEAYLISLLKDAILCAIHTKRITLAPKDMCLAKRLRRDKVIRQNVESSAQLHRAKRK